MAIDEAEVGHTYSARLHRGERALLLALALFAGWVAILALYAAVRVVGFAGDPTAREGFISAQTFRTFVWAIATPFSVWAVLRGGRKAFIGVIVWVGLLLSCAWWTWPSPPTGYFDTEDPFWHTDGIVLWSFVATTLAIGFHAAWQSGKRWVITGAVALALLMVIAVIVSNAALEDRARAEEPTTLPEGVTELEVLRADPLWASLSQAELKHQSEHAASRHVWGERSSTSMSRLLGDRPDRDLFLQIIDVAERSGWELAVTNCFESSWEGSFTKTLSVGPAKLRVSVASYQDGVSVFASITDVPAVGQSTLCWPDPGG